MNDELKSCPCGKIPVFFSESGDNWENYTVECVACELHVSSETKEQVVNKWNNHPMHQKDDENKLREGLLKNCEEIIDRVRKECGDYREQLSDARREINGLHLLCDKHEKEIDSLRRALVELVFACSQPLGTHDYLKQREILTFAIGTANEVLGYTE